MIDIHTRWQKAPKISDLLDLNLHRVKGISGEHSCLNLSPFSGIPENQENSLLPRRQRLEATENIICHNNVPFS